jgi:hypothetical protein
MEPFTKIKNLITSFLEVEIVHDFKLKRIEYSIISTYDGTYPAFNVVYENNDYHDKPIDCLKRLTNLIKNYIGLKTPKDYWISITFE